MAIPDRDRARYEAIGLHAIRRELEVGNVQYLHGAVQREQAREWVAEQVAKEELQAQARRAREDKTYHYVQWTFFAALAAVIVGVIGVIVTLFH
jgi:hypothetical protein